MRIETTDDYSWRTDLYDDAGDALAEILSTRVVEVKYRVERGVTVRDK